MQVAHDPRFTHWTEQFGKGGEKGQGQYWFTSEADAKDYATRLNAINPRWCFIAYERNPLRNGQGQPNGIPCRAD